MLCFERSTFNLAICSNSNVVHSTCRNQRGFHNYAADVTRSLTKYTMNIRSFKLIHINTSQRDEDAEVVNAARNITTYLYSFFNLS